MCFYVCKFCISVVFRSGTDPTSQSLFCQYLVWGYALQKSLPDISEWDEIWWDCFSSKCVSIEGVSFSIWLNYFQNVHAARHQAHVTSLATVAICMRYSSWSIVHLYLFDQIFNCYNIFVVYSGYSQMTSVLISMLDERWTVYSYTARQNRRTVLHSLYCFPLNQVPACLWILICIWIFINDAMSNVSYWYWFDIMQSDLCFSICLQCFDAVGQEGHLAC